MFQPYPYQIECLGEIDKARREARKSGLVVMASGLGKTVTAGLAAKQWLEEKRGRLLYICHQNDILEQAKSTFEAILGHEYTYGFLHGERKTLREVHCLFASFQTMLGFKEYFEPNEFTYVIVDETHHSHAVTYLETLRYFTPEFLLGITATPDRTDKKNIREIYGNEIYSLPLEEALARNLLTPVDYRLLTDEIQLAGIIDTPAGKMSINQLNKKIFVPKRDDEISEIIAKHISECANPRIIVFCSSIFHCNHIAEFLPQSMAIHSRVPTKERALRLELFRQGIIGTVVTVDCFNEGIDIPQANIIVFLRSTSSPTLFLQQLGRGLRKSDGKDRVVVLDFVANCERIKVVYNLWRSVEEKRSVLDKIGTGTAIDSPSPMMVDVHKVKFDETAIKIIDVIEKIRRGYSKGVLIEQLQALAKELGRTPRVQDVAGASKMGKTASIGKFAAEFGSFAKALNAAGYKSDWTYEYTTESLIDQLKILSVELGR